MSWVRTLPPTGAGRRVARCLALALALCLGPALARAAGPEAPQQALDFIATFPWPAATPPPVPDGAFSNWSDAQRQTVPKQLAARCAALWTLAHDAPGTRFLPPAEPLSDEAELGIDLCLAGHLPVDWPGRARALGAARGILDRAAELGSELRLPATLAPR